MVVNHTVLLLTHAQVIEAACIPTISLVVVCEIEGESQESVMSEDTVRLARSGHEPLEIGISQVTTATLARVFSVSVIAGLQLLSVCLLYYMSRGPHHFLRCEGFGL